MTADRFEIIDDGPCIRIVSPDCPTGYHIDDAIIGAIRQQARDLDQLRADLAAAVALTAARDETIAELELRLRISRQSNKELRESAERAEARLAAIEAAPPADLGLYDVGQMNDYGGGNVEWWWDYMRAELGRAHDFYTEQAGELIARPAKD